MSFLCWHVVFHYLFTFLLCHHSFSTLENITDHQALLSFKASLISDPLQLTASWNESTHFCKWTGITCGRKHERVTKIDLGSRQLQGTLSPAIGNLSFLRVILLGKNSFTGKIPNEIGQLSRLQTLQLTNNSFFGEIPKNISRCRSLQVIDFGGNSLTGKLPMEFQSLSNLQHIYAKRNRLIGEIPPEYGNLSALSILYLNENNIQGEIPNSFGRLQSLRYIILHDNSLSGKLPVSISNMSLEVIDLLNNQLEGDLPLNMSNALPSLRFFSVSNNNFTGHIPIWVSNAPKVEVLQFGDNNFIGEVPNFGGLKHLRALVVAGNEHLGSGKSTDLIFMETLTNFTSVKDVDLSNCNFGGEFPSYIGNFSNLKIFDIRNNHIIGKIPNEIGQLVKLQWLVLAGNHLSGTIPNTIGKFPNLYELEIDSNKFWGEIPSSLGNITKLSTLSLASNNLEGVIPSSLAKCRFLNKMLLNANNLSGTIPKEFFHSDSGLLYLDISQNRFIGHLPSEIGELKGLFFLNLSTNHIFGEIPPTFRYLMSAETIDLSSNHLTGKVPSFLANFSSLTYLNLSHNDLEGEVPFQGIFGKKNGVFVEGNSKLCGGVQELHLPKCITQEKTQKSQISLRLKIGISISCGMLAFGFMVLLIYYYLHRRKKNTSLESRITIEVMPMVSYKSLYNATNGFSQKKLIGFGKFSSVYNGHLDELGKVVAIKVLKLQVKGALKSFITECDALKHVRHRNLVKIVSLCSSTDYNGNDFRAIICEYMEEGNLETLLHHSLEAKYQKGNVTSLSLLERVNIGIDIACALEYLHVECGTPLVHCDLKPSNVLLDCDLVAHVSDFGLARFLPEVAHASSMGIKGTFGYAAPEYGMGSEFSTLGDIYSYGILLLEMFTGKSPTNDIFINGLNLHEYVNIALPQRVMEIVDPTMLCNEVDTSSTNSQISHSRILESLFSIFEIGIACSMNSPSERMDASTATNRLRSIKAGLLGARRH